MCTCSARVYIVRSRHWCRLRTTERDMVLSGFLYSPGFSSGRVSPLPARRLTSLCTTFITMYLYRTNKSPHRRVVLAPSGPRVKFPPFHTGPFSLHVPRMEIWYSASSHNTPRDSFASITAALNLLDGDIIVRSILSFTRNISIRCPKLTKQYSLHYLALLIWSARKIGQTHVFG